LGQAYINVKIDSSIRQFQKYHTSLYKKIFGFANAQNMLLMAFLKQFGGDFGFLGEIEYLVSIQLFTGSDVA
jgi:hypothetical protein